MGLENMEEKNPVTGNAVLCECTRVKCPRGHIHREGPWPVAPGREAVGPGLLRGAQGRPGAWGRWACSEFDRGDGCIAL